MEFFYKKINQNGFNQLKSFILQYHVKANIVDDKYVDYIIQELEINDSYQNSCFIYEIPINKSISGFVETLRLYDDSFDLVPVEFED